MYREQYGEYAYRRWGIKTKIIKLQSANEPRKTNRRQKDP